MTASRRGVVAIVAIAIVLIVGAVVWLTQPPAVHSDGSGPLGSLGGPGHESMSVDPQGLRERSWTYGLRLCIAQGDDPATLQAVGPLTTLGSGFRFVGSGVRTFTPTSAHTPIISVDSYPPPASEVPDALAPVGGYAVETPCSNGPREPYTELLVGLAMQGDDGGGWKGIKVVYVVDGRSRAVTLDHDLLICGRSNPVCEDTGG
jgi:hypothetical protein